MRTHLVHLVQCCQNSREMANIFSPQVKVQFKNPGANNDCEVARGGENDSWYHLKCKISGDNAKEKLDKELKIVIREQSASSATIEVRFD